MRLLIVYAHPNPASFNHAMLEYCQKGLLAAGHEVRVKDLYTEAFDPVLQGSDLASLQTGVIPEKIAHEQEALLWAEGLVFIYPLWWYGRPAILKGWFDHVLTNGVAFAYSAEGPIGLLKHKKALVLITAGSDKSFFQANDSETLIHRPMTDGTLSFCGIKNIQYEVFYNVPTLPLEEREKILQQITVLGENFNA